MGAEEKRHLVQEEKQDSKVSCIKTASKRSDKQCLLTKEKKIEKQSLPLLKLNEDS